MRQMGIRTEEVNADEVKIVKDDKIIILKYPSVTKMVFKGQTIFQITASEITEETRINEDDVKLIMEKTGCSRDAAVSALKESQGDIADAILRLESKE